ncbi:MULTISPECIES: site-specific DNA-methyltransferase [unclassified Achromobacter]|uniref:DNA-methyltransferase n=1 Tax=unclassified Achromobacter TaxID=2626865 RepID=UPI000B51688D|nr:MULTISPECIES: site-specific DNA-methyltransferase [unclassified Achromobacter]OWT67297.1 site-specific DNA-methyltransferase [Achromobacter sp. HZ34]OWT67320.1 site-specific DNA-methyltransferase [Achromobacter sp. HZ28]
MAEMNRCYLGDCRDVTRGLIAASVRVQCIVTSPPYFGLRDYGVEGQLGMEAAPEEYVAAMVDVFRDARSLLADDGTLWLNIGDSYANDGKWGGSSSGKHVKALHGNTGVGRGKVKTGLKPKDLIGIPWMLAFALRADGWYLRQEIIWHKPNPMPESVQDRCTKAHEHLFLLTKSERYHFDASAISEEAAGDLPGNRRPIKGAEQDPEKHRTRAGLHDYAERQRSRRYSFARATKDTAAEHGQSAQHRPDRDDIDYAGRRNKRSVWTVATKPYSGAHFAVMPETLVEPCILAGSRPGDIVFDPFMGSGTVASVAQRLGRNWLGAELNPAYLDLQAERTRQPGLQLESAA